MVDQDIGEYSTVTVTVTTETPSDVPDHPEYPILLKEMMMKILKTQAKQRGFFTIGFALALYALFGATTVTAVAFANENKEKQETAATQQLKAPQRQTGVALKLNAIKEKQGTAATQQLAAPQRQADVVLNLPEC